jgi:hypothetical protein
MWAYAHPVLPTGGKRLIRGEPLNAEERKGTMPSKKQRITVYLGPEEYSQIQESATKAGFSLSTFCKRVCPGPLVSGLEHRQATVYKYSCEPLALRRASWYEFSHILQCGVL